MGQVIYGASCPWRELSLGRAVHGGSCPWGELSMGWAVHGMSCHGASCHGANCHGASSHWASFDGASCTGIELNIATAKIFLLDSMSMLHVHVYATSSCPYCMFMSMLLFHAHTEYPCPCCMSTISLPNVQSTCCMSMPINVVVVLACTQK
jgi:hypothetical protein